MTACGWFSVKVIDTVAGGRLLGHCLYVSAMKKQPNFHNKEITEHINIMIEVLPERQLRRLSSVNCHLRKEC